MRSSAGHPYYPYLAEPSASARFGTIKAADGTTLHWEMITPALEPGKRYPVFFQHYGGPHSQTVSRAWGGALQQYLVDRGYIWFQIDNRGSANRGKAFEDAIYHAMGSVEVEDQLAGANYLKTQTIVDPTRIATYGWSYGGYMTLKMLEAASGRVRGGRGGRAGDQMGAVRHPLHRAVHGRSDARCRQAYAASNAIGRCARRSPIRC